MTSKICIENPELDAAMRKAFDDADIKHHGGDRGLTSIVYGVDLTGKSSAAKRIAVFRAYIRIKQQLGLLTSPSQVFIVVQYGTSYRAVDREWVRTIMQEIRIEATDKYAISTAVNGMTVPSDSDRPAVGRKIAELIRLGDVASVEDTVDFSELGRRTLISALSNLVV